MDPYRNSLHHSVSFITVPHEVRAWIPNLETLGEKNTPTEPKKHPQLLASTGAEALLAEAFRMGLPQAGGRPPSDCFGIRSGPILRVFCRVESPQKGPLYRAPHGLLFSLFRPRASGADVRIDMDRCFDMEKVCRIRARGSQRSDPTSLQGSGPEPNPICWFGPGFLHSKYMGSATC